MRSKLLTVFILLVGVLIGLTASGVSKKDAKGNNPTFTIKEGLNPDFMASEMVSDMNVKISEKILEGGTLSPVTIIAEKKEIPDKKSPIKGAVISPCKRVFIYLEGLTELKTPEIKYLDTYDTGTAIVLPKINYSES